MSERSGTSNRRRPTRDSSRPTPSDSWPPSAINGPINELDRVILTRALPEHGLETGDIGTVVDVYRSGEGYEVEFCTLLGETVAVATVYADWVRRAEETEVPHARGGVWPHAARGGPSKANGSSTARERLARDILDVFGSEPMTIGDVAEALKAKGKWPKVRNPRKRIAAFLAEEAHAKGRLKRVGRGEYARRSTRRAQKH